VKELRNALTWFEIPAFHMGRAKKFYETVFNITLEEIAVNDKLKMALFPVEKGTVGGALCEHHEFYTPSHNGPLIYLNGNPDLSVFVNRMGNAGGRILIPKTQISPEYGYMAVFEDTEGNRVALHSRE
jgi:predicted enzyme related to lactoylglutathione lyase